MTPASRRGLWLLFTAFVLYGGTIPFNFVDDPGVLAERWRELPLNPFISPETGRRLSIPDVVQNILFFAPFGALGVMAAGARSRWTWVRIAWVTSLGAALSCIVEGLQLLTYGRVASTADLMTNATGSFAGAVAVKWGGRLGEVAARRLRIEGLTGVYELRLLAVATVALAVAFLQPFDVTLELGGVVSHVRAFQRDPWQVSTLRDEGLMALLASLFAMTLASYLSAIREKNCGRKAVLLGAVVIAALEASQFFVVSRLPSLWDLSVGVTGLVIGATFWTGSSRIIWPGLWQSLLIGMTIGAAALQALSPFQFTLEYHGLSWWSFSGYDGKTTFEKLGHIIELMLIYFPLGFWLGLAVDSVWRALPLVIVITLVIAGPLEYAQGWVAGRYPDVLDVGLALLGGAIGVLVAKSNLVAGTPDKGTIGGVDGKAD